jgi:NADH:ubiquinone oxidoreductase subunit C
MWLESYKDDMEASEVFNDLLLALQSSVVSGFVQGENSKCPAVLSLVGYRQNLLELSTFLKLHSAVQCDTALDCNVIDCIDTEYRFTAIYTLQSHVGNVSYQLITKTNAVFPLVSLQSIYPAFNWAEREVWDMFGIVFIKHPDLRRILTDYGFVGHPLRKDFPITGFREIHYEDTTKNIEYNDVELPQSFRLFSAVGPWQDEKEI